MNIGRLKVIVVIGTRPEAIKMCPVVYELKKKSDQFHPIVLVSGQHREMLSQVLNVFQVEPDYNLNLMEENQTLESLSSKALPAFGKVIKKEQPDILLVQGDTTTSFIASLSAFYQNVKVGHIEAGLRTFNKYCPFPEEMNRSLISVLCDLHFAPTRSAANNLSREGIVKNVFITGNTVIDALFYILENNREQHGNQFQKERNEYRHILLTAHRRENFGKPLENICCAIKQLISKFKDIEITYPVHKNPNVRESIYKELSGLERINLVEPMDYINFVNLMNGSYFIMTDSGGIQEEAPSLGKPVLVLRNETERPEAVEAGTVKIVGTETESIVNHSSLLLEGKDVYTQMAEAINPYGDGKASKRIINIIKENIH